MTTTPGYASWTSQLSSKSNRACAIRAHFATAPSTELGDWRAGLISELGPQYERTHEFERLISQYVTEGQVPDLSALIRGCMEHAEENALRVRCASS